MCSLQSFLTFLFIHYLFACVRACVCGCVSVRAYDFYRLFIVHFWKYVRRIIPMLNNVHCTHVKSNILNLTLSQQHVIEYASDQQVH